MSERSSRYGKTLLFGARTTTPSIGRPCRLWTDVKSEGNGWTVVPHLDARAGTSLRYEILARKVARPENVITTEGGEFTVGSGGQFALAGLRIGVGIDQLCDVDLKIFDGSAMVGSLTLRLPD
jgi:hypothetical protein